MRRRLTNFVVLLSLLLSVVSAVMWGRSQFWHEAYVFEPRHVEHGPIYNWTPSGWDRYRIVGSADGRLVLIEHDEPSLGITLSGRRKSRQLTGYRPPPIPVAFLNRGSYVMRRYLRCQFGELPGGVAEWASCDGDDGFAGPERRYFAVSWLALCALGTVAPVLWAWLHWLRPRRRPTFSVIMGAGRTSDRANPCRERPANRTAPSLAHPASLPSRPAGP